MKPGIFATLSGAIQYVVSLAKVNVRLQREVSRLEMDLVKMQRQRDYWVAYQLQTAQEAGRAQQIMVNEIDRLRRDAGAPEDSSWIEHVAKWEKRRVKSDGSHPFSASWSDIGGDAKDGGTSQTPKL